MSTRIHGEVPQEEDSGSGISQSTPHSHDKQVLSPLGDEKRALTVGTDRTLNFDSQYGAADIPGWPNGPEKLQKSWNDRIINVLYDIASVLIAFPFFMLAIAAVILNGRVVDDSQWSLFQTGMNAAVTAFPIIFGGIVSDMTKAIAAWKLERGTTLGLQEQLMGSMSFLGAIQTSVALRMFNLVAIVMIALSVINPLGGQASIHLLSTEVQPVFSHPVITYFDVSQNSLFDVGGDFKFELPSLDAIYTSSLLAPETIKNSTVDTWGNVKIPNLSPLENSTADSNGWFPISSTNISYSSLLGIPIAGLPSPANTTFTIRTSYFSLACNNVTVANAIPITFPGNAPNGTFQGSTFSNLSSFSISLDGFNSKDGSFGHVYDYLNDTGPFPLRTLLFQSNNFDGSSSLAYCPITTAYIDTTILCINDVCAATAIRPSPAKHPNSNITAFEFTGVFSEFSESLTGALGTGDSHPATSTATEEYLVSPGSPLSVGNSGLVLAEIVTETQMSERLAQLLNTYYLGSCFPSAFLGDFAASPGINITVTATSSVNQLIYACSWAWWTVFVFSNVVMLVSAVVAVVLKRGTRGPDILGYVSSLTRDSAFVGLSVGGSGLDGLERARLAKGVRVKLGDVGAGASAALAGYAGVGKIVLAREGAGVEMLVEGRDYF